MIGRGLTLALGASALWACGAEIDDGAPGDFPPTSPSAPILADGGPMPDAGPDMGPVESEIEAVLGTWAHVQIQRGTAILPVLGAEPTETFGVMRMAITADEDGALIVEQRICEVRIERERDIVVTEIPDTFVEALTPVVRAATFEDGRFEAPWFTELRAVALDAPDDDPLPTEPDDPRILDPDMDGQPGLTARVSGLVDGEVYLVQRSRTRLEGSAGFGTIDGLLGWSAEESVVGADDPLLLTGAPFEPDPDPAASVFLSTRIDTERDCAWIRANQDLLFSR